MAITERITSHLPSPTTAGIKTLKGEEALKQQKADKQHGRAPQNRPETNKGAENKARARQHQIT